MDTEVLQRIVNYINTGKLLPFELEIRPTNKCNLKCLSCWEFIKNERNRKEVSFKRLIKLIKEAYELEVRRVHICGGGEPLVRKKAVIKTMEKVKLYNMYGRLITNGTLFDEASIRNIVEIGWDEILFSIDGPDAKTHDYLRGVKGTFDRVIKNLELFNKYKKKYKTDLPKIVIAPLLTRLIYNRLEDFIELAKRVEAQEICLQLMIEKTKDCKNLKLSEEETKTLKEVLIKAKKIAENFSIKNNFDKFLEADLIKKSSEKTKLFKSDIKGTKYIHKLLNSPCFFPWFYIGVFADGTTQPCADAPSGKGFENISEKSLKEIWFGKQINEYRRRLLNSDFFPWCKKCCGNKIIESREIRSKLASLLMNL